MTSRFLIPIALVLFSCRPSAPQSNLSEAKLQSIFVALLEENERYRNLPPDSLRHVASDSILRAFEISEQELRGALEEYKNDVAKWQKLLKEVEIQLENKEKQRAEKPKV